MLQLIFTVTLESNIISEYLIRRLIIHDGFEYDIYHLNMTGFSKMTLLCFHTLVELL